MVNTQHVRNDISSKALRLFLMDTKQLRGKYQAIRKDIPHSLVKAAKRDVMIDQLLVEEFGEEAIDQYREQVQQWEQCRALVEGQPFDNDERFLADDKLTVEEEVEIEDLPRIQVPQSQQKQTARKRGC